MSDKNFDSGSLINQTGNFFNSIQINPGNIARNNIIAGENPEQEILAEVAKEIQQLLQNLEKSYPTETAIEKMIVVTKVVEFVENTPLLKQRLISALKSAGTEAFKEALDHPVANLLVGPFEEYTKL